LVMAERRYELDLGCYWWLYLIFIWYCPNFSAFLFHRIYAAYGGIFVVMELLWGLIFESVVPDTFDINGAAMACVGVAIIYYAPRRGEEKLWSIH
jgi:small multidrug resistance family-3 protein